MIRVHYGNCLERLADALGAHATGRSATPLAAEIVAVAHPGMQRWLSLALARRHGVAANMRFPLPAALVWQLLRGVLPDVPERSPFEPASLRWAVLAVLDEVAQGPGGAPVRRYLDAADPLMRYELASKIAGCVDRYLVYRPDWVRAWAAGESALRDRAGREAEQWQANLLRVLRRRLGATDWLSVLDRLGPALARAPAEGTVGSALPSRVHLFALSALSPAYLDVLGAFAHRLEVHMYVLNPCREYWGDIVSARARPDAVGEARSGYYVRGNPLLASFGRVGRELVDGVQDLGADEHEIYRDPGTASILASVQQDILDLRDRTGAAGGAAPPPAGSYPDDRSIQVHVCHSPVREMEVLHDQLLALLERHPELAPGDIVVMAPRIDDYAPAIQAVFGHGDERVRIPVAIADRRPARSSPLVAAYFKLLRTARGRLGADEVLGLLGNRAIARRFRVPDDALPVLDRWIRESGARWGADGEDRGRAGLPPDESHTWRFGIDRLLLGLCMTGEEAGMLGGLHPYDGVAGGDAELLEGLTGFVEALLALAAGCRSPRPVRAWAGWLRDVARDFFEPAAGEESEVQAILGALDEVVQAAGRGGFEGEVPLTVAEAALLAALPASARLGSAGGSSPMLTGRVTFCEMVPMRSIPCEVVCLIGMSDGVFPRSDPHLGFDLVERFPRRGDRTRRDDDRYLFLECILAARRVLYLSYVGLDQHENAALPPSPLVAELIDYVSDGFGAQAAGLVTAHPLQRFSPRYFEPDSPLFSYHEASCRASRALVGEARPRPPLVDPPLASPVVSGSEVELEALVAALLHPARHLLVERLGVRIEAVEEVLNAVEPFGVEGRERQRLRQAVLDGLREGLAPDGIAARLRGDGQLPSGAMGDAVLEREWSLVSRYFTEHGALAARAAPLEIDIAVGDVRLVGTMSGWVEGERVFALGRLGRLRARDRVEAWIRHLAGAATVGSARTRYVAVDQVLELAPVASPLDPLETLAVLYRIASTRPLPFFPESARTFAGRLDKGVQAARRAARATWNGERGAAPPDPWAEVRDPYNQLAFAGTDPLGEEFEAHARSVFEPLREHATERAL